MSTTSRDLQSILAGGSASFRRLNDLGGGPVPPRPVAAPQGGKKRLRQATGPTLNKTEQAALSYLERAYPLSSLTPHALTFRIANGCRYTPDLVREEHGSLRGIYEVKGPYSWDDSIVKLKVAAAQFPWAHFWLMSPKDKGRRDWRMERVLP